MDKPRTKDILHKLKVNIFTELKKKKLEYQQKYKNKVKLPKSNNNTSNFQPFWNNDCKLVSQSLWTPSKQDIKYQEDELMNKLNDTISRFTVECMKPETLMINDYLTMISKIKPDDVDYKPYLPDKSLKCLKVRIFPTDEQMEYIDRHISACNYIYNKCIVVEKALGKLNKTILRQLFITGSSGQEIETMIKENAETSSLFDDYFNEDRFMDVCYDIKNSAIDEFKPTKSYRPRSLTGNVRGSFTIKPMNILFNIDDNSFSFGLENGLNRQDGPMWYKLDPNCGIHISDLISPHTYKIKKTKSGDYFIIGTLEIFQYYNRNQQFDPDNFEYSGLGPILKYRRSAESSVKSDSVNLKICGITIQRNKDGVWKSSDFIKVKRESKKNDTDKVDKPVKIAKSRTKKVEINEVVNALSKSKEVVMLSAEEAKKAKKEARLAKAKATREANASMTPEQREQKMLEAKMLAEKKALEKQQKQEEECIKEEARQQALNVRKQYHLDKHRHKIQESANKVPFVAIDPGLRNFLTCYDQEKAYFIGDIKDLQRLKRMKAKCNLFQSFIDLKEVGKASQRRQLRRKKEKLSQRITNIIKDFHHKTAIHICRHNEVILIPEFGTQDLYSRAFRHLSKGSVKDMTLWSHCSFREILKHKSTKFDNVRVYEVKEDYTSKTCSSCGALHPDLGSNKTYECNKCNHIFDRDINGAKNIFLKNMFAL
jgi:transposase